jgi:hypothetical protein
VSALSLTDFVLLGCHFEVVGEVAESIADVDVEAESAPGDATADAAAPEDEDAAAPEGAAPERGPWLSLEGVDLRIMDLRVEEDEFVLFLNTRIADATAPYRLDLITGSSFALPDPPVTAEQAAATLVFITYPYVREVVASITGRSPYQSLTLPPLTKLPHPKVVGETVDE